MGLQVSLVSEGEGERSPKIVPLRESFENMQALLARIAEDPDATGFAGCVLRKGGDEMVVVTFDASRADIAFAALMLQQNAMDFDD